MRVHSIWDTHPDVREFAVRLNTLGTPIAGIAEAVRDRFGDDLVPSRTQIYWLRRGLKEGRWPIPEPEPTEPVFEPEPVETAPEPATEAPKPPKPPEKQPNWDANKAEMPLKARTLLGKQCVACRVKGMISLSGRGCFKRQMAVAGRKRGFSWHTAPGVDATHPGFAACVGCAHRLEASDLEAAAVAVTGKPPPTRGQHGRRIL